MLQSRRFCTKRWKKRRLCGMIKENRNKQNRKDAGETAMTVNEYQKLAMTTLNRELSDQDVLINGVMGLCGEAGEAIDIVKKHLAHGHPLDREHLIEELGDIAWYIAETATALGVELDDVFAGNIAKLKARYPEGFDKERSMQRT